MHWWINYSNISITLLLLFCFEKTAIVIIILKNYSFLHTLFSWVEGSATFFLKKISPPFPGFTLNVNTFIIQERKFGDPTWKELYHRGVWDYNLSPWVNLHQRSTTIYPLRHWSNFVCPLLELVEESSEARQRDALTLLLEIQGQIQNPSKKQEVISFSRYKFYIVPGRVQLIHQMRWAKVPLAMTSILCNNSLERWIRIIPFRIPWDYAILHLYTEDNCIHIILPFYCTVVKIPQIRSVGYFLTESITGGACMC